MITLCACRSQDEIIVAPSLPVAAENATETVIEGTEVQHVIRAFSQQVGQLVRTYHKEAIGPVKNDVAVNFLADEVCLGKTC